MGADGARKRKIAVVAALAAAVVLLVLLELLVGSSGMSVRQCVSALFGSGDSAAVRIMRHIRLPRLLAAVIAGAGLSVSGLIMQTVLGNPMADPFATSALAFVFAAGSVLVVLALCRLRDFSPNVVVLAGIALGSVWTAATTILQFYATDVGLSAAVIWSFGDLGRATYRADWIMLAVTAAGIAVFAALAWRYNALLSGGDAAGSMGVNVALLRWVSLLLASLITAVCVSFLGMIGFVGIICPHAVKRLVGHDHRWALPAATLCGGALLLAADAVSRSIGSGSALPVGAITSLLGAPFFLTLIFGKKEGGVC